MKQLTLDLSEGRIQRDKGIKQAIDRAEADCPDWPKLAYEKLTEFVEDRVGDFQAEDVRSFAAMDDDFPLPKNSRAWGGVFVRAINAHLVKKIGCGPVSNPIARCANSNIYVKA